MALSIQGSGQGFFVTERGQKADILHRNSIFKPPTENLSETENIRKRAVFREPDAEDESDRNARNRGTNFGIAGENNRLSNQNVFGPLRVEVRLGKSLKTLEELENAPPRGGNTLSVSGNNITVSNADGDSVAFNASDNGRMIRTEDDTLVLRNDTQDTSITIQPGSNVTTTGSGELTVFGEDNPVTVESGESFETGQSPSGLTIRNPNTASSLELGASNPLTVESQRANQTDTLSIQGTGGAFITFSQGETGTLTRNDDGTITIANETTGESTTVVSDGELTVAGQAKGTLRSESTDAKLTLKSGDDLTLRTDGEGTVTVRDETSAQSTSIAREEPVPRATGPLQFKFFEDLENRALQALTDQLITRPQQEEAERNRENQKKRNEERLRGQREDSQSNQSNSGNGSNRSAGSSPFERSNPSKFAQLGRTNNLNSFFGQEGTNNQNRIETRNLQSLFSSSDVSRSSSFNQTA